MCFKKIDSDVLFRVKAKPNSPQFSIKFNDQLIIHCKSRPEKNRANLEIIKELKKIFDKDVKIISGFKSKNKKILIHNITEEEIKEKMMVWKRET